MKRLVARTAWSISRTLTSTGRILLGRVDCGRHRFVARSFSQMRYEVTVDTPLSITFRDVSQEVIFRKACSNEDFATLQRVLDDPNVPLGKHKLISAAVCLRFSTGPPSREKLAFLNSVSDRLSSISALNASELAECAYCLNNLKTCHAEVVRYISLLNEKAEHILQEGADFLELKHVSFLMRSLYGVGASASVDTKNWIRSVTCLIEKFGKNTLDSKVLISCSTGLHSITSSTPEERRLIGLMARLVSESHALLTLNELCSAMHQLQHMSLKDAEVRNLLLAYSDKICESKEANLMAVYRTLKLLQLLGLGDTDIRKALANLTKVFRNTGLDLRSAKVMLAFLKKMNFESLEEKEFLKVLSGKLMMVPPATLQKFKMFDDLGPISENDSMEIKQFKSIFSSSRWQLAESADVVGDGDVLNDQSKSMRQKVIINSPRDSQNDLISSSQVGEIFFAKVPKGCQPDWSQVKNHNDVSDVILRYNLKDASDPLVREVLVKLTFKLCELRFVKNIQPDFVNKVMFGLRNMSDDVPEVRHLLSVLQPTFQSLMGSLSAHQLCMAIYGLRRMTGNTKEADAILSVFNSFAPNINKLFGWYVVRALEGLHGLVSSGSSKAIKLMQYLLDRSVRDKVTFNAASIGDCMCDLVDCDPIGTNFITDKLLPDLAVFENYVASGKTVNMEEIWTLIQRLELVQYKINAGVPLSATKDLPIVTLISSLLSKFRSHAEKSSQLPIIKITPQILKVANLLSLALADRRGVKVSHHKYIYLFPCDIIIQQYANDEKSPSLSVNIELFRAVDEKRSVQKLRDNYLESLHNVVVLRLDKQFLSSLTRENIVSSVRQRLVKDLETSDRSLDLKKIVENIFADTLLPVGKIPWPNLLQQGNNEKRKWRPKMPT